VGDGVVREPGASPRRRVDRLQRFLAYLTEIEQALMRRDALRVTALLRKRTATHLPREVREELLAVSRQSVHSLRAPIRFLRFQHRMIQLAAGGERLPTAQTELPLGPRAQNGSIRFNGRCAASHELNDAEREDNGA
jgi:hypothetical protein